MHRVTLVSYVCAIGFCAVGMFVHKGKRDSSLTLRAFIDAVTTSGISLKEIADALGYTPSHFAKILRGAPYCRLDIEQFEGRLPYAVWVRFLPKLAEIALSSHMQQSAAVLSEDKERAS